MKNVVKTFWNWLVFLLTGKGEITDNAVEDGLINHSGQGRDKYGR